MSRQRNSVPIASAFAKKKSDNKKRVCPSDKLFMGWVSYLNRAATTNYLCCGQALEDSLGAGRIGLTHNFCKSRTFF